MRPGSDARRAYAAMRGQSSSRRRRRLRACRARGLKAEAGFEMLVQQVPAYLRFFDFDALAKTLQTDMGAVRSLLYPE
jgi:hypothetical protein